MDPGLVAVAVVISGIVFYAGFLALRVPKRSIRDFPYYQLIHTKLWGESSYIGLLILVSWFAICGLLAFTGHDVLTGIFWAGSILAFLVWRIVSVLYHKCPSCGKPVQLFREGAPFHEQYFGIKYLFVCHTCKTVEPHTIIKSVDS